MLTLTLMVACGPERATMSEAGETTAVDTTSGDATDSPTTSGATTASTSGSTTEANSTSGTTTTTGGSTDTDSVAGEACRAWYRTQTEIFRWFCECDVANGLYESVDLCLPAYPDHGECSCQIFEAAAETAELLDCYDAVDQVTVACLQGKGLCGNPQQCFDAQAQGHVDCGQVPARVCEPLHQTCGDGGPLGQCAVGRTG